MAYQWSIREEEEEITYPEFAIPIPSGFEIHGIDVSKYQRSISWKKVKGMEVNGIRLRFAFMKASEGLDIKDPTFKKNWSRAQDAGLYRGAYHYLIPSKDGKKQAQVFTNLVDLEEGDLPPVLDIEQTNGLKGEKLRKPIRDWLQAVEYYYGVKPIIYTNANFYEQHLAGFFDDYPLWVAHYLQKTEPRIGRKWDFWQHSEKGRVNGISTPVDFNVFNGDSSAFFQMLKK